MDLNDARKIIDQKMTEHGLTRQGWRFEWGYAKQTFGSCNNALKRIRMSVPLTELNDETQVTDTILHEIAHALAGRPAGHGPAWKAVARSIGCSAARTYGAEVVAPKLKYTATCPGCGKERQKARKTVVSCGRCSPVFDRAFLLTYVEN